MLVTRSCRQRTKEGAPCRQPPLRDADVCFWHSPDHAAEASEARRLGGLRRRREHAVAGAYEFDGLEGVPQIRRIVEVAVLDALALENSIARGRLLVACALAAAKLLEVGDLEARLTEVEGLLRPRLVQGKR